MANFLRFAFSYEAHLWHRFLNFSRGKILLGRNSRIFVRDFSEIPLTEILALFSADRAFQICPHLPLGLSRTRWSAKARVVSCQNANLARFSRLLNECWVKRPIVFPRRKFPAPFPEIRLLEFLAQKNFAQEKFGKFRSWFFRKFRWLKFWHFFLRTGHLKFGRIAP